MNEYNKRKVDIRIWQIQKARHPNLKDEENTKIW